MNIKLYPSEAIRAEGANEHCPSMTPYLLEGNSRYPLIIVIPGGGYSHRADHEGSPVAKWLNSLGISAVVLNYRVNPDFHTYPMEDAQRAIKMVRHYADEWQIDKDRVGVLGFSAGGHLASTVGTHFEGDHLVDEDPISQQSNRPNLMILCYPVITMGKYTHLGSKQTLLGRNHEESLVNYYSNEKHVDEKTPPTFLWHTADDSSVPVENSIHFVESLSKHNVSHELHIFESGPHGLGLAKDSYSVSMWTTLCEIWLKGKGF
ncbi:alpha/beta hydrolase [Aquibacillus rhizosphaerae]|uniref:Alpha/beta hydrolase n=1 Tax=Aquibacillus rhizosphaerae TaxID=3051431 RepID=A0ABT7L1E4_9BACI|nr:alpha/beta hydrolase [Aquibacillus sp. LR5S19]MDL4839612.1 alpha/beta hydrolase [Aquibacillus sp. LR5S19]